MVYSMRFQNVFQIEKRRFLFLLIFVATMHLFCQTLMLPYGSALVSLLPGVNTPLHIKYNLPSTQSSAVPIMVGDPLLVNASDFTYTGGENRDASELTTNDVGIDSNLMLEGTGLDENPELDKVIDTVDDILLKKKNIDVNRSDGILVKSSFDIDFGLENVMINLSTSADSDLKKSSVQKHIRVLPINENQILFQGDDSMISTNGTGTMSKPFRKRMRCNMPPKSVTLLNKMNRLLVWHRKSSRATRPRSSSVRDQEIVAAKRQIMTAPSIKNDPELYDPLFRNASMFRRSYELMERTLRVYVYKDGEKPIFHQPVLKGLYASEGWFMKLMEGSKHFVVKDPKKAHLFYMPFSSRTLEHTLYVRNSHNRTNLRQYLKNYAEKIAAKYSFWNRTGGADHFLVACHDWAPYETRHHMEHCIKALCNADVTVGFKIGRDISLPEAYVRSARDPLRDLGGKPASERHIFAFYAGNMHGYLREILLRFWNNKDPDMKIFGPMPPGVASKMNYIQHMKSSKYCICPKGYEVNSPRIVEAIFYECVPVIISDNFVPPFFEVLDWDAFAVIVAEKDIPNLKDILLSIPQEKYLKMQLGIRKVQKHFLWHVKPIKYDLFHMTLHSIWYNRVFQFKPR